MPAEKELPSTLRRSGKKSQRTWSKAHDAAVETYGEGERSHRTAFSALKHTHEKVGDRTAGGVDANASKQLYEQARRLGVHGSSKMISQELVQALRRASDRDTPKTREGR
ncbi:MAG TPA: ChaB family protein [Pseudonocardiaceae bacterium]